MVQDTGLPGIDRGLRGQGTPMEPGGQGGRGLAFPERPDGVEPDRVYARGSVIVKFRGSAERNSVASAM